MEDEPDAAVGGPPGIIIIMIFIIIVVTRDSKSGPDLNGGQVADRPRK